MEEQQGRNVRDCLVGLARDLAHIPRNQDPAAEESIKGAVSSFEALVDKIGFDKEKIYAAAGPFPAEYQMAQIPEEAHKIIIPGKCPGGVLFPR